MSSKVSRETVFQDMGRERREEDEQHTDCDLASGQTTHDHNRAEVEQ